MAIIFANNTTTTKSVQTVATAPAPAPKPKATRSRKKVTTEPTVQTAPAPTVQTAPAPAPAPTPTVQTPTSKGSYDLKALFNLTTPYISSADIVHEYSLHVPKVNPYHVFDEDLTNNVLLYLLRPNNDCLWVSGDAGCGKTSTIIQVCARLGWSVQSITCSNKCESLDLVGHSTLVNGSLQFEYGALANAMKYGEVLILNEIDTMNPNDLSLLNDVLEGKPLVVTLNGGEVITPHKNFRVVVTANTFGGGDDSGMYNGVRVMNQAFLDRFRFVHVDYPSTAQMQDIIKRQYPNLSDSDVKNIVKLTTDVRAVIENGLANGVAQLSSPFSTRTMLKIAGLLELGCMTPQQAVECSLGARLPKSERDFLTQCANDVWGHDNKANNKSVAYIKI